MYYIEYTSNSGKSVPSKHRLFESIDSAKQHGQMAVASGMYKRYTVVNEGYKIMPPMDPKYVERKGLEGPFTTLSGKVVYYDPKEGKYYDPDTDMYMSYDEYQAYDNDRSGMKDERDEVKESVEALRQIVADKNAAKVNGTLVDLFTASAIMQVYDAVNDANKEKIDSMLKTKAGLMKMADFAMSKVESATNEGCSPHKKGTEKYKKHMAAMHAEAEGDWSKDSGWKDYEGEKKDPYGNTIKDKNLAKRMAKSAKKQSAELDETLSPEEKRLVGQMYNKDGTLTDLGKRVMNHGKKSEVNEGVADEAVHMERDHEVQMARSDLYKIANYAVKLHKMLKNVSEEQGIQGWMQAKITKAADYMSSVAHTLEYDMMEKHQPEPMAEALDASKYHCKDCGCQMHNCKPECDCSHDSHDEKGSWWADADGNGVADAFESVEEMTSAGGVAAVAAPMTKRKKK